MSDSQKILFFAGGFLFVFLYGYITYLASKRSGKSFLFLFFSHKRNALLSEGETRMQYIAVGIAIVTISVPIFL